MFCTAIHLSSQVHCRVCVAVVLSEAASTGLRSILASVRSLQSSLDALIAARVPTNVDRASITYLLIMNKVITHNTQQCSFEARILFVVYAERSVVMMSCHVLLSKHSTYHVHVAISTSFVGSF